MAGLDFCTVITGKGSIDRKKLLWILSSIFVFIAGLMIFQDYLGFRRKGYSFYFSESLLLKTI